MPRYNARIHDVADGSTPPCQERLLEELILRDHLALDRTRLANERTLLAYLRTSLMLLVAGATAVKFVGESPSVVITGWVFIGLGVVVGVIGSLAIPGDAASDQPTNDALIEPSSAVERQLMPAAAKRQFHRLRLHLANRIGRQLVAQDSGSRTAFPGAACWG